MMRIKARPMKAVLRTMVSIISELEFPEGKISAEKNSQGKLIGKIGP